MGVIKEAHDFSHEEDFTLMKVGKFFKLGFYKVFMDEIEKRYLVKDVPEDLDEYPSEILEDNYIPPTSRHPIIRIRRIGNKYFITKKKLLREDSKNFAKEETIILDKDEYNYLKDIPGKKLRKKRYQYKWNGRDCEVDVYEDDLKGLVIMDFEFDSEEEMIDFKKPDFCIEIIDEECIAGGYLCGKSFEDVREIIEENIKVG